MDATVAGVVSTRWVGAIVGVAAGPFDFGRELRTVRTRIFFVISIVAYRDADARCGLRIRGENTVRGCGWIAVQVAICLPASNRWYDEVGKWKRGELFGVRCQRLIRAPGKRRFSAYVVVVTLCGHKCVEQIIATSVLCRVSILNQAPPFVQKSSWRFVVNLIAWFIIEGNKSHVLASIDL